MENLTCFSYLLKIKTLVKIICMSNFEIKLNLTDGKKNHGNFNFKYWMISWLYNLFLSTENEQQCLKILQTTMDRLSKSIY